MTRLVDKPTVEVSVDIDATPEAVWPLVSDINVSAAFQDEFQGADWLDSDVRVGARFRGRNSLRESHWETTCHIVAFEEPRVFGWAVDDPDDPVATWTFTVEPNHDGSLVTYTRVIGSAPSGLSAAIERYPEREEEIIARRDATHTEHMTSVLAGIKALAEAGG